MAKAGLRKVLKTVHSKQGTVRRSYWMKSAGANSGRVTLGQFARKHGKTWAGSNLASGVAGGAGAYLAARHGKKLGGDAATRALVGHTVGAFGTVALIVRSKRGRAMEADYRRMGFGARVATQAVGTVAHAAGVIGGAAATHKAHSIFGRVNKRREREDPRITVRRG